MDDAVFISDSKGTFVHVNKAFATFHRFKDKDEYLARLADYPEILDVFQADGELLPLDQWVVSRALRGETETNAEYTLKRKDTGETWDATYNFGPFLDQQGNITGSVVVARDITERKRANESLRASEAKLKRAQEIGHFGNWEWDIPSDRNVWSVEMYRIYGVDPKSELSPEIISGLVAPDDLWKQQHAITGALAGRPVEQFEIELSASMARSDTSRLPEFVLILVRKEKKPS